MACHDVNMPFMALNMRDPTAVEADSLDRERPVIFHCHVGARSLMAAQAFRQAGFEAYSMAGGLELWKQEGRPVHTNGG